MMVEYTAPLNQSPRIITPTLDGFPRRGMLFTGQVHTNPNRNKPDFITHAFQGAMGFVYTTSAYLPQRLESGGLYRIEITSHPERLKKIERRDFNFFHAFALRKLEPQEITFYENSPVDRRLCTTSPEDFIHIRQALLRGQFVSSSNDVIQRDINYLRELQREIIGLTL